MFGRFYTGVSRAADGTAEKSSGLMRTNGAKQLTKTADFFILYGYGTAEDR